MADDAPAAELSESTPEPDAAPPRRQAGDRLALIIVLVAVLALTGLVGWTGFRAYRSHQEQEQRNIFLQAGRQGALNLTTIDFHQANADVQRILDGASGQLYDNFSKRSRPFIDAVLRTQSKSVGKVTEAAVESESGEQAKVLVAVTVTTSNAGAAQQEPRSWRMRLSVQKVGGVAKVSNVEFVP